MEYKELSDRLIKRYEANETGSTFVTLCSRRDVINAATAINDLLSMVEKEKQHRLHAEEHADKFMKECQELYEKLKSAEERAEKAEKFINAIEDDLDRGNDNDWAREHISEYRNNKEE